MADIEFAQGIYFNQPHERAPDFVLGSISIRPDKFSEWLAQQTPNEKGYVRLKVNIGKQSGEPYVALDTWDGSTRQGERAQAPSTLMDDDDEAIPF